MKTKLLISTIVLATFFITYSCNNASDKKVKTSEAKSVSELSEDYSRLTACHHSSKIYWKGTKPGGAHDGYIKLKEGEFYVDGQELKGGVFVIDMNSIVNSDLENEEMNAKLVGHLKSNDFFMTDSFPTAKFELVEVLELSKEELTEETEGFTNKVLGNLTVKGITKSIEFPVKVWFTEKNINVKSNDIVLNRTDWNITYMSKSVFANLKDKFIDDEFTINIDVRSMGEAHK